MKSRSKFITLLLADDDPDDCLLVQEALKEKNWEVDFHIVSDGEKLMDYLYHRGDFKDPSTSPRPDLILLDLNMPKKDGREALVEIKATSDFKRIPIIVLTTSSSQEDIVWSYELGVCSLITKPVRFEELSEIMDILSSYWFQVVQLPR